MSADQSTATPAPAVWGRHTGPLALLLILATAGTVIASAMRYTSPTFDEVVFVAGGARGLTTGAFDLAPDHPPLMQYVYGLPVWLGGAILPDEEEVTPELRLSEGYRYQYAAALYFAVGNDPERITFLGRLPAVFFALVLITVVFVFVRRWWGDGPAVLAAMLMAFMPDILAHGGVAYSDVPVSLGLFAGAWAIDSALRSGALRHAALAGMLAGLAVCVKISAALLLPLALALALMELLRRRLHPKPSDTPLHTWLVRLPLLGLVASLAAYLMLVAVFRGDFLLEQFLFGLDYRFRHMTRGHGAVAFLLGQTSATGWWYFFPVAFLFKTSAGLHVLLLLALATLGRRLVREPARVLESRLRWVAVAAMMFGAVLLTSSLNIGFRYAMPVLPLVCVITAAGIAHAWRHVSRRFRMVIVAAAVWAAAYPLSWYPHFLPFISEYGPGRDRGHEVLVDSSLDWGQGLLALRDFMRERGIPRVFLSYFGSNWPAGYGIAYEPLYSFFPLPPVPQGQPTPEYMVVSATNLRGVYFVGDPFAHYRGVEPDTVLAHTLYIFRVQAEGTD